MAPCCNNTVTPKMIKSGNVSVGDRIQLEDFAPASQVAPANAEVSSGITTDDKKEYIPVQSSGIEDQNMQVQNSNTGIRRQTNPQWSQFGALPYSQMTKYMSNVSLGGSVSEPSIVTPQAPMTPNGYDEEISYDAIQSLNGFLRTQIGRYMRIEQLIGSNTIQDRFGFLVGIGSNFILLQEITTGNIMVLDIFSIRLTYIYYSQPVIPEI